MKMHIKKLHPDAKIPTFAHESDAGMDFFSLKSIELAPGKRTAVSTGIAIEIPPGHVGLIWDKGSISHKKGIKSLGGVFDSGYRGEILLGIVNLSDEVFHLEKGHKIAQMLIQKVERPELIVVDELSESDRGEKRYGSTGAV